MEQAESSTRGGIPQNVEGVSFVQQLFGAYTLDWRPYDQQQYSSSHNFNENQSPLSTMKPQVHIAPPLVSILENSDMNQIGASLNDRGHNNNSSANRVHNNNNNIEVQQHTHQPMATDDNDTEVSPLGAGTFKMIPLPTTAVVGDPDVPLVPPKEIVIRLKTPIKVEIPRPVSPVVRRSSAPEVPKWLRIEVDGPSTKVVHPHFRPEDEWVPLIDPHDAWLQEDSIPAPPVTPSRRPRFLASPFSRRQSRRSSAPEQLQELSGETSKGDQEERMESGLEFQPQGAGIREMDEIPRPMPAPRNSSAPASVQPRQTPRQRQRSQRRGARFFFKQESYPEVPFSEPCGSSPNNVKKNKSSQVAPDGYYQLDQYVKDRRQTASPKSSPTPTFAIPHGKNKNPVVVGDGVYRSDKGLSCTYDLYQRSASTNSAGQSSFHTAPTDSSECESFSSHGDNHNSHGVFHPRLNVVPETPEQRQVTDTMLLSPKSTTCATPKRASRRRGSLWGIVSSPILMKKKSTILASSKNTGLMSSLDLRRSSRGCLT